LSSVATDILGVSGRLMLQCRLHLQRIDQITATIDELSTRITEAMAPFPDQLKPLDGIPGVGPGVAGSHHRGDRR
jgi:hypothetical protein